MMRKNARHLLWVIARLDTETQAVCVSVAFLLGPIEPPLNGAKRKDREFRPPPL